MAKDFDQDGFLKMLREKYADCVRSAFMELLAEIVYDAHTSYNDSRDEIAARLAEILPDLSFGEAAQFVDDSRLTEWGKTEKREWKETHK